MERADKLYNVIVSDKAGEMLVSHARFLAQVSEHAAQKLIKEFRVSAKSLKTFPEPLAVRSRFTY